MMQLNDDNVGNIIEFSDRPYRIVNMMKAGQLQDVWGEGKNSFKDDPPNAVLSASGAAKRPSHQSKVFLRAPLWAPFLCLAA